MVKAASVHSTPVGLFEFCVSGETQFSTHSQESERITPACLVVNVLVRLFNGTVQNKKFVEVVEGLFFQPLRMGAKNDPLTMKRPKKVNTLKASAH